MLYFDEINRKIFTIRFDGLTRYMLFNGDFNNPSFSDSKENMDHLFSNFLSQEDKFSDIFNDLVTKNIFKNKSIDSMRYVLFGSFLFLAQRNTQRNWNAEYTDRIVIVNIKIGKIIYRLDIN